MKNDYYDYERREGILSGLPYTKDIVSIGGANYHCWFPPNLPTEVKSLAFARFKRAAHNHGDPVSFSWGDMPHRCEHKQIFGDMMFEAKEELGLEDPLFITYVEGNNYFDFYFVRREDGDANDRV